MVGIQQFTTNTGVFKIMKDVYTIVIITHTVIYILVMLTVSVLFRTVKINPDLLTQISIFNTRTFLMNVCAYITVKFLDL